MSGSLRSSLLVLIDPDDDDDDDVAVLPLLVSLTNPRAPLTANKTNKVSCVSHGSSPPAVISWWLDATRISHQDSQVGPDDKKTITRFEIFSCE